MTDHPPRSSFYAAMRDQILATPLPAETRSWVSRLRPHGSDHRRLQVGLVTGATAMLAAAVVVVVLIFSATTSTPPAYAVTTHPNGSITITLREVATGIPALNAKLQQRGYDVKVIPITAGCHSPDGSGKIVMHPDPHSEYDGSVSMTYTPRAAKRYPAPSGFHYVLAAKQLSNGRILAFIGALKAPVPTCLPYNSTPSNAL